MIHNQAMRMADLAKAEQLVNEYIGLWEKQGLRSGTNIVECNDFGFEHLQLIRNGFQFETLNHDEFSRMTALLERELKRTNKLRPQIFLGLLRRNNTKLERSEVV